MVLFAIFKKKVEMKKKCGGRGGGGTLPNVRYCAGPALNEKNTQSDVRLCQNKGSKRSKNSKFKGSTRSKINEKIGTICFRMVK